MMIKMTAIALPIAPTAMATVKATRKQPQWIEDKYQLTTNVRLVDTTSALLRCIRLDCSKRGMGSKRRRQLRWCR